MGISGIDTLLFIGFYVVLISFGLKLWTVLDYVREACEVVIAQNGDRKELAITLFKQGKSIKKIARTLKVSTDDVNKWVDTKQ